MKVRQRADDGFRVLERLANVPELKLIPVMVVSARDRQRGEERALKAGARAYLQKPWDDDVASDNYPEGSATTILTG